MVKIINTAEMPEDLSADEAYWVYNGLDSCITAELRNQLLPLLEPHTRIIYNRALALQPILMEMQLSGIRINQHHRSKLLDRAEQKLTRLESQLNQLLTEGLVLGLIGGVLGIMSALAGVQAIVAFDPGFLPRLAELSVDRNVLLFAVAITLITTLLFSLLPAVLGSHGDLANDLRRGAKGAGSTDTAERGPAASGGCSAAIPLLYPRDNVANASVATTNLETSMCLKCIVIRPHAAKPR